MNVKKLLTAVAALVFALTIGLPAARADEHDQLSILTFDQAIQIPSPSGDMVVLAPGTYRFKLAPIESNRNIVQVYNADQTQLLTTIPTITTKVLAMGRDLSDHTVLTFAEGAAGEPLDSGQVVLRGSQYRPRVCVLRP